MLKKNKHTSNARLAPDQPKASQRIVAALRGEQGDLARRASLLKSKLEHPAKELNHEYEPGYN